MNPLQRAAVRRKVFYLGAIVAILTITIFYRGLEARTPEGDTYVWVPFGRDDRASAAAPTAVSRAADWVARKTVLSQARRADLREVDKGDPEVAGEAFRLGLFGSRGLVVTYLWVTAIEKQKRNDFHEFQVLVKTITKLQPHFLTPWLYQSWNIAYNVSVEMHSLGDMYFYITEGIRLLAEGERRNKRSPDMRYEIAFMYQNKFGVADQAQTLRCLFDLSCIPPGQRNAAELLDPDGEVRLEQFRQFCEAHPHLVRRLRGEERQELAETEQEKTRNREKLRCRTPKDVVQFLKDNWKVPTRYKNHTDLADADKQFPVVPPRFNEAPNELNPQSPSFEGLSAFHAARAWYSYANALLPPPPTFPNGDPMPASSPRPGPPGTTDPFEYDPIKYRMPRKPMLIIFRQGPPRAQTHIADIQEKDGWFDEGWEVDARSDSSERWFPRLVVAPDTVGSPGADPTVRLRFSLFGARAKLVQQPPVVVGRGPNLNWSLDAWREAADMWARHGARYALELDDARFQSLRKEAGDIRTMPPEPTPAQHADPVFMRRYLAANAMASYAQNRQVTQFPYFRAAAAAEANTVLKYPDSVRTVDAREVLWRADQVRRTGGNHREAIDLYHHGLTMWRSVLRDNPAFHRPEGTSRAEEDAYEMELEYIRLLARYVPADERSQDPADVLGRQVRTRVNQIGRGIQGIVPFLPNPLPIPQPERSTAMRAVVPFLPDLTNAERFPSAGPQWTREAIESLKWDAVENFVSPFAGLIPKDPPVANSGTPWIRDDSRETVRTRHNIRQKPQPAPPNPAQPTHPNG